MRDAARLHRYLGQFTDWADVARYFGFPEDFPAPPEIVLAWREAGEVLVLFREAGVLLQVAGSGEWSPELASEPGRDSGGRPSALSDEAVQRILARELGWVVRC